MLSLTLITAVALAQDPQPEGEAPPDAQVAPVDGVEPPPSGHSARAMDAIPVRAEPRASADRIGEIGAGAVFRWTSRAEGSGCAEWAALDGGGYACLDGTRPVDEPPTPLPTLVRFDPPAPDEWDAYLASGTWDRDVDTDEALTPYVYAKRWRKWKAPLYANLDAWNRGDLPIGRLQGGGGVRTHFASVVETDKGAVLVRPDGAVVPVDQAHVYPIDRFEGRDLALDPPADGWVAGWVIAYAGARLADGTVLPYHAALDVRPAADGIAWEVRDKQGHTGTLDDRFAMHHWVDAPPPPDIADDELWIDVDNAQQTLAIRRGKTVEWVTLTSTGLAGATTPGVFRVTDKVVHADMDSRFDAVDPYHVEEVPWIVHFRPRYSIHGTYWHWGFGHRASHGCVNLSVKDARTVFERTEPALPDGWHTVFARPDAPGTVIRVR